MTYFLKPLLSNYTPISVALVKATKFLVVDRRNITHIPLLSISATKLKETKLSTNDIASW